ncbi:MAG: glycerol-3-phosphate 1-O-acyltransferase PlsY [Syntrophobacterales bacterium]|jgi:glycerol-3-phosphate acyltransferase PlsY
MALLSIALFLLAAYLLGSIPTGYLIGRWVANVDVRTLGSKNIGATNVARNLGLRWGLLVLLMDMAKGALPVVVALSIWSGGTGRDALTVALVALAAFFGHLSSVFLRFRGGKGVAIAFGISVVLVPKAALVSFAIFLLVTWIWRYVSLGSLTALLTLPAWAAVTGYSFIYLGLTSVFALSAVIRHRTNIRALLQGKERKI